MNDKIHRNKNLFHFVLCFLVLFYMLIHVNMTYAKQIQIVPIFPQATSTQAKLSDMPVESHPEIKEISDPAEPAEPSESEGPLQGLETSTEATETLSGFERFISGDFPETISTNIRQFGYDLFSKPPSTFAPVTSVPVGPGYVLGPGDEVRITVWGKVEGSWNVVIDRDGNIGLPKVGIIGVTGLTFSELKTLLKKEF